MKEYTQTDELAQIISQLPLKERVSLANIKKKDVEVLQSVFDLYIRSKVDSKSDEEYNVIMEALWGRLQETHKMRIVQ